MNMFKNMRRVILFDMFLYSSFKIMTSFTNVARTTARTDFREKISDHQELGLYMKNDF